MLRSLETSAERKVSAQNKQLVDPGTGRKMFVPDTKISKSTYYSHFKSTCSIHLFQDEKEKEPKGKARPIHYIKESTKLNNSHEDITTTMNHSLGDISQMTRRLEGKPESVATIPGKREQKLAKIYADIIWTNGTLHQDKLSYA